MYFKSPTSRSIYHIFIFLFFILRDAELVINSGCRCYLFQSSEDRKEGRFHSPNYPSLYPKQLPCLLYAFIANQGEIVRLQFTNFNMKPKSNEKCTDVVHLYLNLEQAELGTDDSSQAQLCGNLADMTQTEFYSSSRVIILEMQTDSRDTSANGFFNGFQGNFIFESKKKYAQSSSFVKDDDQSCSFHFVSDLSLASKGGQFFSPNYPQNYPNASRCLYTFQAQPHERVVLEFKSISLEDYKLAEQCSTKVSGDMVTVFEGNSEDGDVLRRFKSHCGQHSNEQAVSHGTQLLVLFVSDENGKEEKGFFATYRFIENQKVVPTSILEPGKSKLKSTDDAMLAVVENTMKLQQNYSSSTKLTGFFTSPNYPRTYPPSISVIYKFSGLPGQRVILNFQIIQLSQTRVARCGADYRGDRLEIFDGMSVDHLILQRFCGKAIPDNVWSTREYVTVKFVSDDTEKAHGQGFKAFYTFENIMAKPFESVQGGKERNSNGAAASTEKTPNCSVTIHSRDRHPKNGLISTPGYPSFYPQGINCHWSFIGQRHQRVRLKFLDLDVASQAGPSRASQSCRAADIVTVSKQQDIFPGSQQLLEEICGNSRASPFSIMSTEQPNIKVYFKSRNGSKEHRGIQIRYEFVTDYGVTSTGKQQTPGCRFIFDSKFGRKGNFSSPNYPSNYPESITCQYEFRGLSGDHVRIEFEHFNLESSNRDCNDYIKMMPCGYHQNSDFEKLCTLPSPQSPLTVNWSRPCGVLSFHSDEQYTRTGFFATYTFIKTREAPKNMKSTGGDAKRQFSRPDQLIILLATLTAIDTIRV